MDIYIYIENNVVANQSERQFDDCDADDTEGEMFKICVDK